MAKAVTWPMLHVIILAVTLNGIWSETIPSETGFLKTNFNGMIYSYDWSLNTTGSSGCEDLGGVNFCKNRGDHWICFDDEEQPEEYRCECEKGYKNNFGNCTKKTVCDDFGAWYCEIYGPHWICRIDNSQPDKFRCECEKGYKDQSGTCLEICRFDKDCKNGGICTNESSHYFCSCRTGFTGDNCEINEACENLNKTCEIKGGYCHYITSLETCVCYSGRGNSFRGLNTCGDKCKINSCVNGNCKVIDGVMMCRCLDGYEGQHCEREKPYYPGYVICIILIPSFICGIMGCIFGYYREKQKQSLIRALVQKEIKESQTASQQKV